MGPPVAFAAGDSFTVAILGTNGGDTAYEKRLVAAFQKSFKSVTLCKGLEFADALAAAWPGDKADAWKHDAIN